MAPSPNKFPLGGMGKEERGRLKSSQATLLLLVASIQILPGMLASIQVREGLHHGEGTGRKKLSLRSALS